MIMILSMLKYLLLLLFYHRHPLKVISNVEITSSDDYPLLLLGVTAAALILTNDFEYPII